MPDVDEKLRILAPSTEIPEWAVRTAAGCRDIMAQTRQRSGPTDQVVPLPRRTRRAWLYVAVAACLAFAVSIAVWGPWRPTSAGPAAPGPSEQPAPLSARRQATGYIEQTTSSDTVYCPVNLFFMGATFPPQEGKGGCANASVPLRGIDWASITWSTTEPGGARVAPAMIAGTFDGTNFVVDKVTKIDPPMPAKDQVLRKALCDTAAVDGITKADGNGIDLSPIDGVQDVWYTSATPSTLGVLNIAVVSSDLAATKDIVARGTYKGAVCVGSLPGKSNSWYMGHAEQMSQNVPYTTGLTSLVGGYDAVAWVLVEPIVYTPEVQAALLDIFGPDDIAYVRVKPVLRLA